ncbi:MAG: hypothetical protein HZC38_06155 [Chloroflexi bacterium]|nr:hypothetical protein [Chloroflexota bacterium]MBI5350210.1 hypothetical protein [Chloroflexota bacterium]MBI5712995.1 hypothetical protein [Chloroflexota bacterium]
MFNTEERVDRLEVAFEQFMAQTSAITSRLDTNLTRLERMVERNIARADQETHDLKKQMGELGNRLGTIVEDMIVPSIRRIAREELNCGAEKLFLPRATVTRADGRRREFDALYVGEKAILLNESKATVRPEYAKEFVEFLQSGEFSQYFPEYLGKTVVPVFSSINIPDDTVTYLTRNKIYAVGMGDEEMTILNKAEVDAVRT